MCPALQTNLEPVSFTDPYENFMRHHLQYYGYFRGLKAKDDSVLLKTAPRQRRPTEEAESDSERESSLDDQKKLIYSLLLEGSLFKSKQIVFDNQEGQVIPRLKEPRDLFNSSIQSGVQTPRWPKECDVIKKAITHIEWDPPDPEVFYKPTGKEQMPQGTSDGNGKVVYEIKQAYKGSYFIGSRTGGRPCATNAPCGSFNAQTNNDLQFESRFESGNLQKAMKVGVNEYELTLRTDLYTSKHTQWFYFQVKNMRKGVPYRFTITNLMKSNSLYNAGLKPLLYSEQEALLHGIGWRREGNDIKYYKSSGIQDGNALYRLTWTFEFQHDDDTCYFAHCYPYTYSDLQRDLHSVANDPIRSQYCKLRALCRSLAGNTVYLLTITSPSSKLMAAAKKKAVVVTARVHPGETNGSWMMKGFLDFLLSGSPDAELLRDTFIFKVVPMLNPDGVIVGNYRCSLTGRDLNRNYRSMLKDSFPCIWHTQTMIKRLVAEREVLLYCDFHGHSRRSNVFMYGCNNKGPPETKLHERVFPLMLSKNAPDKFLFKGCKFKVQKSKEGTGRIVMWRKGIVNSYTMESTFGGSTLGNRKGTHFSAADLKSMGHHFCDTLLDYCDPDNTKFKLCVSELQSLVEEEIREKLKRLGRGVDSDITLSDISLSDLESSTGGSNSSESDGLPAHLLHIAEKFYPKKKRLRSRKERNSLYKKRHTKHQPKPQEIADISEPASQTVKPAPSKVSRKYDKEKRNAKMKSQEGSLSQNSAGGQTSAVQTTEKPVLSFSRKPESVTVKTQLINKLPTSYVGEFSVVDHVCHRHVTVKSREAGNGNRLPLIITVIQRASVPPYSKDVSSIKQHPPPFHAMLDFNSKRRQVTDNVLKREAPIVAHTSLTAGIKPYSLTSNMEKQKYFEVSATPVDLQLSLSPKISKTRGIRRESLMSLVSSDYFDSLLLKPKKELLDTPNKVHGLTKSESYLQSVSSDLKRPKQLPL
ncbi:cytosolic carboxypeptidase 2 [Pelobates cultripes]|uniref:Cytosolic carboxypeptidase 2 n=1 Tax=Pelobates cultripes TaxID=61616 RepID=A0AAD1WW79_PELCU|nr:cytosolic carboxypeptidase 2 [Pelobates cultripes]